MDVNPEVPDSFASPRVLLHTVCFLDTCVLLSGRWVAVLADACRRKHELASAFYFFSSIRLTMADQVWGKGEAAACPVSLSFWISLQRLLRAMSQGPAFDGEAILCTLPVSKGLVHFLGLHRLYLLNFLLDSTGERQNHTGRTSTQ